MVGQVDLAHPALAERPLDHVLAEHLRPGHHVLDLPSQPERHEERACGEKSHPQRHRDDGVARLGENAGSLPRRPCLRLGHFPSYGSRPRHQWLGILNEEHLRDVPSGRAAIRDAPLHLELVCLELVERELEPVPKITRAVARCLGSDSGCQLP